MNFEDEFGTEKPEKGRKRTPGDLEHGCETEEPPRSVGSTTSSGEEDNVFHDGSYHLEFLRNRLSMPNLATKAYPQQRRSVRILGSKACGYHLQHKIRSYLKEHLRFKTLKAFQIIFAIYIIIMTFVLGGLRDPETGFIVDGESTERTEHGLIIDKGGKRAMVATSTFQLVCLGVARFSAGIMYPSKYYQNKIHTRGPTLTSARSHFFYSPDLCLSHQVSGDTNTSDKVTTVYLHEHRLA